VHTGDFTVLKVVPYLMKSGVMGDFGNCVIITGAGLVGLVLE
jgi:hypothetical protein